ncbi:MAG: hypothetical protein JWQ74_2221 [Marmoricola sp.]|nr:hypothetical protein [Marmoricola sp.]
MMSSVNRALDAQTAQRSLVATLEITVAASTAHVLAGGHLPAVGFLFAFAATVFAVALATIGRYVQVAAVVPFVLAAQIGLHGALDAAPMAHHDGMTGMGATGPFGLTSQMFWAHLVTALVTAIVLLCQEQALAAATSWLRVWGVVPVAPGAAGRQPALPTTARTGRRFLLRVSPRRGPPAYAVVP